MQYMHVAEPGHTRHSINFVGNSFQALRSPRNDEKESGSDCVIEGNTVINPKPNKFTVIVFAHNIKFISKTRASPILTTVHEIHHLKLTFRTER